MQATALISNNLLLGTRPYSNFFLASMTTRVTDILTLPHLDPNRILAGPLRPGGSGQLVSQEPGVQAPLL